MKDFFKDLFKIIEWVVLSSFVVATLFALVAEAGTWILWVVIGAAAVVAVILALLELKFGIDIQYEAGQVLYSFRRIANRPWFKKVFGFIPVRPDSEMRLPQEAVVEHVLTQLAENFSELDRRQRLVQAKRKAFLDQLTHQKPVGQAVKELNGLMSDYREVTKNLRKAKRAFRSAQRIAKLEGFLTDHMNHPIERYITRAKARV